MKHTRPLALLAGYAALLAASCLHASEPIIQTNFTADPAPLVARGAAGR